MWPCPTNICRTTIRQGVSAWSEPICSVTAEIRRIRTGLIDSPSEHDSKDVGKCAHMTVFYQGTTSPDAAGGRTRFCFHLTGLRLSCAVQVPSFLSCQADLS